MPKILEIIIEPNSILRQKSKEIKTQEILEEKNQELFLDMEETMIKKDGAGLAAPQTGKNIRVIVVNAGKENLVMINPEITKLSWAKDIAEEGCLSVPGVFGEVKRSKKINVVFLNSKGEKKKMKMENFLARVVQHEIDHLDGILFTDKVLNITKE